MPNPQGAVVVPRDFAVLSALATARYLTNSQITRLVFEGRDERVARRRLNRLAGPGPNKLAPLIRPLSYRGHNGAPLKAWTLTEAGYVIAKQFVPHAAPPGNDVGPAFLEHSIILNDLLVDLVLRVRQHANPFEDLPFRWIRETGACIAFEHYDRAKASMDMVRIRPDATLEIGEARLRLFLECETGAHTIVSADPTNTGATWAKIQRYAHLIGGHNGQHDATTPYSLLCSDGIIPVLVFLVQTPRRRDAIRKLVEERLGKATIKVRAFTFEEAPDVFATLVSGQKDSAMPVEGQAATTAPTIVASLTMPQLDLLFLALRQCRSAIEDQGRRPDKSSSGHPAGSPIVTRFPVSLSNAIDLLQRLRNSGRVLSPSAESPNKEDAEPQNSAHTRPKALTAAR